MPVALRRLCCLIFGLVPVLFVTAPTLVCGQTDKPTATGQDNDSQLQAEILKLNQATTEELQKAKLRQLRKDKEKAKALVAAAVKMLGSDSGSKLNYNAITILGRTAQFVKNYDAAERFYERQIELAQKVRKSADSIIDAYENLILLYFEMKRYDQVIGTCERFLDLKGPEELERVKPFVIEQLVQAKAKKGDFQEAMRITQGLLQLSENSWYFLRLKGYVEREAEKYKDAIKTFQEVLEKLEEDENLKPEIREREIDRTRYILSALYIDINDIDQAAKQLEILVKKNPTNATYKNDLGYIWADNDRNLDEAEKLIREALELDRKEKEKLKEKGEIDEVRENAAYLDSMGWVLFKKKRYKEALEYLKKAAMDEEEGQHLEIWDHLADCYMALG
ncbi:MAG: tetratricopeptide repeat protein, partial [Gemmataceae bacterium]|nr:tetratricopeptide repeat protein [Gemmataceae bacterium]